MTIHATAVATDGRGVLLLGRSGSGKSDLALRLLDKGFRLIADDAVCIRPCDASQPGRCCAAALPHAAGRLMVRGIGAVRLPPASLCPDTTPLSLAVRLDGTADHSPGYAAKLDQWSAIAGCAVPLIDLNPFEISAPCKVILALQRWGF